MQDIEEWRPILGFEGIYEVSSHGRVRSLNYKDRAGRQRSGKLLKTGSGKDYPLVGLRKDGITIVRRVHQLVADAFLGPCPPEHEVGHKDHTRTNNHKDNLEYVTHLENMQHAARSGRHRGDLSLEQVQAIREELARNPKAKTKEIADRYGVAIQTVSRLLGLRTYSLVPNADGSEPKPIRTRLSVDRILDLQAKGMTLPQIGKHFGVDYSTPYQMLRRAGIHQPKGNIGTGRLAARRKAESLAAD